MHIHNHSLTLSATNLQPPVTVAAQQAANVRRALAKAALNTSEESDSFESFMIGQPSEEGSARQRNRGNAVRARAFAGEDEKSIGTNLSVSA